MSSCSYIRLQAKLTGLILCFLICMFDLFPVSREAGSHCPQCISFWNTEICLRFATLRNYERRLHLPEFSICGSFCHFIVWGFCLRFYCLNIMFKTLLERVFFSLMCVLLFIWNGYVCSFVSNFISFSSSLLSLF